MNLKKEDQPALLLIDIQKGFEDINYWGSERNNPQAEDNARLLLQVWREQRLPVFHIKHCSTNPESKLVEGNIGNEFNDKVQPIEGETIIKKNVNSAFIGTDLKLQLDTCGIKTLIIIGLTTDHCVSTTARMAGNYGYNTFVVHDATASFNKLGVDGVMYSAETIHQTALASLNTEFATIISTSELINLL